MSECRPPLLLLAEDDPDIAFLVCREFQRLLPDWEICHVPDGKTASQRLKQNPLPNVLVTDLNMPNMDGFALIEWTRSEEALKLLPVFVLSNSADPEAPCRCQKLGANQFFPKDMQSLQKTIRAVIDSFEKKMSEPQRDGSTLSSGSPAQSVRHERCIF
jgi:CheY-like chemotaxis protein